MFARTRATLSLFGLALVLAPACSPMKWAQRQAAAVRAKPRTFIEVEKALGFDSADSRKARRLAQLADSGPRCLKDRLDKDVLLKDIKAAESAFGGQPGPGTLTKYTTVVQGTSVSETSAVVVNLGQVPAAQLAYLKVVERDAHASKNGDGFLIEMKSVKFDGCTSVPCLLNRAYGSPTDDDLPGLLAYDFFLRTGYVLNTGSQLMNYTAEQYKPYVAGTVLPPLTLKDFLFTSDELKALWKVSHTYGNGAFHAATLDRIYRMPKGRAIVEPNFPAPTCGLAQLLYYPRYGDGGQLIQAELEPSWIQIVDVCLGLANYDLYAGSFYTGITHEMAHHVDYSTAHTGKDFLSTTDDWKKLSGGWKYEERMSGGELYDWWDPVDATQFVSTYARTSPGEDFAESMSYSRYRGNQAKKDIPVKLAYLAQKVFGGRTYDDDGLIKYYAQASAKGMLESLSTVLTGCVRSPADVNGATDMFPSAIPDTIPGDVSQCVKLRLGSEFQRQADILRSTELEACGVLDAQIAKVKQATADVLAPSVGPILQSNIDLASIQAATDSLRADVKSSIDPREVWLSCRNEAAPDTCFGDALGLAFDQVANRSRGGLTQSVVDVEKKLFVDANSYGDTSKAVELFYRQLLGDSTRIAQDYGRQRWDQCLKDGIPTGGSVPATAASASPSGAPVAVEDVAIPPTLPFTGGEAYVSAKVLACINLGFEADSHAVRDRWAHSRNLFQISDPAAQQYILEFLSREYLSTLQALAKDQSAQESARREPMHQSAVSEITQTLLADLTWLGDANTADVLKPKCSDMAGSSFDRWVTDQAVAGHPIPAVFEAVENLRTQWTDEACAAVLKDARISQQLDQNRTARDQADWGGVLKRSEALVSARADAYAPTCVKQYRTQIRSRSTCLKTAWPTVESQSMSDWDRSADGTRFATRRRDVKSYISGVDVRARLQNAAISRMESGIH